jgi:predicted nucleic acid-binding protein
MNTRELREIERDIEALADEDFWDDEARHADELRAIARRLGAQIELLDLEKQS